MKGEIIMRILLATDTYKPVVNGVVTSIINLSNQLRRQGHEVKILTLSNQKNSWKQEDVYYLGSYKVNIYPDARVKSLFHHGFMKEIAAWAPEIIHTQSEFSVFFLAKKLAKKLSIPIIHTYHTLYEDYTHYFTKSQKAGQAVVARASKLLLNNVDAVIAPTDKVKKTLTGYGIERPIFTVPTGIDLTKFQRKENSRKQALKKQYGIKNGVKVLVSIGRLGKEKNTEELIRFVKLLLMNRDDMILLLVGDGPDASDLKAMVTEWGLADKIIFTGIIAQENIADYYQLGDIFVSASTSETQGLTYLEAMASGLPLLCKQDECLAGVLKDGYNGYFYEKFEDFLQCITELLDCEDVRSIMGIQSSLNAKAFTKEHFAIALEHIYEKLIETKTRSYTLYPKLILGKRRLS